jgi:hypothetical protein
LPGAFAHETPIDFEMLCPFAEAVYVIVPLAVIWIGRPPER